MPRDEVWIILDGRGHLDPDAATMMEVCHSADEACRVANEGRHGQGCFIDGPNVRYAEDGKWRLACRS